MVVLFSSCETDKEKEAMTMQAAFEQNSETILKMLENWENESPDYSMYADDFVSYETGFGSEKDSLSLEEIKKNNQAVLNVFDFKLLTKPPVLLPGVDPETKKMNGSVRYYIDWEVTRPATDSTEKKTGVLKMYQSVDFDEEGKMRLFQSYGDFSALVSYLLRIDKPEVE